MKCQNCGKNEATFYYKSNINGRVMESHLCPECARQLGLVQDMRRPMMSSFWDDDDFFTRPFRMLEPLLGGFGSRLLTEFPEPVDVTQQARRTAAPGGQPGSGRRAGEAQPPAPAQRPGDPAAPRRGNRELRGSCQAPGPAAVPAPGVSVTPINRKEV